MQANIIIKRYCYYGSLGLIFMLLMVPLRTHAQYFDINNGKKRVTLPFKMVRNLIVIQLQINHRGPYNFVMDTGVGIMLITDPALLDSINRGPERMIKIYGLGGQDYEAIVIPRIQVDMPGISSYLLQAAALKQDPFSLSAYAGMPVHGLLGYDFFNRLAVKFNFGDSTMLVARPQNMRRPRRWEKIPITIEDKKPYLLAPLKMPGGKVLPGKLVIGLGAGHPLSLERLVQQDDMPKDFIKANLGIGLTGPIDGYISRVPKIELGKYQLQNVITSFPDVAYLKAHAGITGRDGNLGLGLLKRFNVLLDYSGKTMYIKARAGYKAPFEHDMSGMEYYFEGKGFDHLIISRIEAGSPAHDAGLMPGDEIAHINFAPVNKMRIGEIDELFRSRSGRNLVLDVYRNNQHQNIIITLKRRI